MFTVLLTITCLFYGLMLAVKLTSFGGTNLSFNKVDFYFSADFVSDNDFMLAFGLSAYDNNSEPIEDPSIGVVNSYYKSWSTE